MLVLLPPSETKHQGGDECAPLVLEQLSFGELAGTRERLITALERVSARPRQASAALGLGPTQLGELERNLQLRSAPTMPAIERYTGVLFDSLDVRSLSAADRRRADARIAIGSALFGVVRATDRIPAYRLSGGSRLPRIGTLGSVWKPTLGPVLAERASNELVVDLRSGTYRALAPVADAVTVRVLSERPDGSRSIVSHFNKATKGLLARLLVRTTSEPSTMADVMRVAKRGGLRVEATGERSFDVITSA